MTIDIDMVDLTPIFARYLLCTGDMARR
jgi:hypothetical protein